MVGLSKFPAVFGCENDFCTLTKSQLGKFGDRPSYQPESAVHRISINAVRTRVKSNHSLVTTHASPEQKVRQPINHHSDSRAPLAGCWDSRQLTVNVSEIPARQSAPLDGLARQDCIFSPTNTPKLGPDRRITHGATGRRPGT